MNSPQYRSDKVANNEPQTEPAPADEPTVNKTLEDEPAESSPQLAPKPVEAKKKDDEPLTPEEFKAAASDLSRHAKNAYLKPARRAIRSAFDRGRKFLRELGDED